MSPTTSPALGNGASKRRSSALETVEKTRKEASRTLVQIAEESGRDSAVYALCEELWQKREEDARASLRHGDVDNAVVILEGGLHILVHGPGVLRGDELALEDAAALMSAC